MLGTSHEEARFGDVHIGRNEAVVQDRGDGGYCHNCDKQPMTLDPRLHQKPTCSRANAGYATEHSTFRNFWISVMGAFDTYKMSRFSMGKFWIKKKLAGSVKSTRNTAGTMPSAVAITGWCGQSSAALGSKRKMNTPRALER